jgi:aspartyl-tRNA(Asn)/glutamyl-tRNA(Gln) amidotransferase subunit C
MTITRATVEQVAELAKLGLTDDELERFGAQLNRILDYIGVLSSLPDRPEAADPDGAAQLRLRDDVVEPSLTRDVLLANAPHAVAGYLQVPPILD